MWTFISMSGMYYWIRLLLNVFVVDTTWCGCLAHNFSVGWECAHLLVPVRESASGYKWIGSANHSASCQHTSNHSLQPDQSCLEILQTWERTPIFIFKFSLVNSNVILGWSCLQSYWQTPSVSWLQGADEIYRGRESIWMALESLDPLCEGSTTPCLFTLQMFCLGLSLIWAPSFAVG